MSAQERVTMRGLIGLLEDQLEAGMPDLPVAVAIDASDVAHVWLTLDTETISPDGHPQLSLVITGHPE